MITSMLVSEWMSPAETVSPDTPFRRALTRMQTRNIRCLVIVDQGRLVGIVTTRDMRHAMPSDETTRAIWDVNATWDRITVAHLMNDTVVTIEPHQDIVHAARLMLHHKIGKLPVVDRQGHVLGILTAYDIHRMLIASRRSASVPREPVAAQAP